MALSYTARRRLALLILVVGMPAYVVVAVSLMNWLDARYGRLPVWAEVAVYLGLGFLWALPFRRVFRGVGQPDPAAPDPAAVSEKEKAEGAPGLPPDGPSA